MELNRFLEHRVSKLLNALGDKSSIPVDLNELARVCGILSIEERQMIPEAALKLVPTGFRVYLQSNFVDAPGARVRRRFSLAHEIAHTFFYESRNDRLKPIRDAPRGNKLELACHRAASLLLVPPRLLTRELQRMDSPIGPEAVTELAHGFDVSFEVMLRRLDQIGAFESERVLVLVRTRRKSATIEFAPYPPWLRALLPKPDREMEFHSWLQHCVGRQKPDINTNSLIANGFEVQTTLGTLRVSCFKVNNAQCIFELNLKVSVSASSV